MEDMNASKDLTSFGIFDLVSKQPFWDVVGDQPSDAVVFHYALTLLGSTNKGERRSNKSHDCPISHLVVPAKGVESNISSMRVLGRR